ncbi:hypothetical protein [Legionella gresilensis]|uniref:hypothetical protein n=1 Tax=Legionella gresilensis TaxID=91823 RepID=UPI001040F891|nr:hypothetical protein [Legionella gresilensis]
MATSAIKQISLLPSLIISSFLLAATVSDRANAETVNVSAKPMQLAWHGHGWGGYGWGHHGWRRGFGYGGIGFAPIGWGGYGPGWGYRPGWYGPGYRFINTGPFYGCQKRCFVNRWNRLICATRCY